ncbi:hypothetical protein ACFE04_018444 [Oxalis oulophora]
MLGDGLFHVAYMAALGLPELFKLLQEKCFKKTNPNSEIASVSSENYEDERRAEVFQKDQISNLFATAGYAILAIISIIVVPLIFHQIKWYFLYLISIITRLTVFLSL